MSTSSPPLDARLSVKFTWASVCDDGTMDDTRLLIVENDDWVRDDLCRALEDEGYDVAESRCADDATTPCSVARRTPS